MPAKPEPARGPPKLTIEGIQLCLANSKRLLKDSFAVSEPTAVALTELSIEEASKGLMMALILQNQTENTAFDVDLNPEEAKSLEAFGERNRTYIDRLDGQLSESFQHHRVKLRFLRFALQYDKVAIPILRQEGRFEKLAAEVGNPIFRPSEPSLLELDRLDALLKRIRVGRLNDLQRIKNEALYVGLATDGSLVAPGSGLSVLGPLRELATLTLVGLNVTVTLMTR